MPIPLHSPVINITGQHLLRRVQVVIACMLQQMLNVVVVVVGVLVVPGG